MSHPAVDQTMQLAVGHYQARRFGDAEQACRQILSVQPNHSDALNLLAVIAGQTGAYDRATELIRSAIAIRADNPAYHCNLGIFLQKQGKFDQAIASFERALELNCEYPQARYNLGVTLAAAGESERAFAAYERIAITPSLTIKPELALAYHELANSFLNKGRVGRSIACYQRALALKPDSPQACYDLGNAYLRQGQLDSAIRYFQQAVSLKSDYPEAHDNLGIAWQMRGQFDNAIASHRRALEIQPRHPNAHNNLGVAFSRTGQFDQAIASFEQALQIKPDYPQAYSGMGNAWRCKGQLDRAIACCQRALELNPNFPDAHNNLGSVWLEMGQIEKAISCFQRVLDADPNNLDALNNLGNAQMDAGQIDQAVATFQLELMLKPGDPQATSDLGNALVAMRDFPQAERLFRAAIAAHPENAVVRQSLGMLLLLQGDFENGLPLFEWRKKLPGVAPLAHPAGQAWDGSDLSGRPILLYADGAFGDVFQFARYLPRVAQLGGKIILAVPPQLKRLFQQIDDVELVALDDPLSAYDLHCPLMSLPLAFKTTIETIPENVPYLKCDAELSRRWRERVPADDRRKVGLAWAGGRKPDPLRSASAADLAPLAKLDHIWFCSLHKPAASPMPDFPVADFSAEIHDFADTAALIENLDLVITIDTSIAHLAGALGKKVWVLLKDVPDWRWLLDRTDSPWYPTMRLFRQTTLGDWQTPIHRIVDELAAL